MWPGFMHRYSLILGRPIISFVLGRKRTLWSWNKVALIIIRITSIDGQVPMPSPLFVPIDRHPCTLPRLDPSCDSECPQHPTLICQVGRHLPGTPPTNGNGSIYAPASGLVPMQPLFLDDAGLENQLTTVLSSCTAIIIMTRLRVNCTV